MILRPPTAWRLTLLLTGAGLVACDGADPGNADDIFAPDRLLNVTIELDPDDWQQLRLQGRDLTALAEGCRDGPPEKIYPYFTATVTVDEERLERVGVRKKGFLGSLSVSRPSLKIKFNELVDGQRLSGMRRMTLNNNKQDPSLVRQCLSYDLLATAGLPAPRCNFARVFVNDEDLGIYSHVESIKKPYLERQFGDDSGTLFEGQISDFTPELVQTFEIKTNETTDDRSKLEAMTAALQLSDDELLAALEPLVDVDTFID